MIATGRRRTFIHVASLWVIFALAGLLFASRPTALAATTPEQGQASTIIGTALSGNGEGLGQVVVTLEPVDRSKEAGVQVWRVQTEQATLINRGGPFTPGILVASVGTTASFRSADGLFHTAQLSSTGRLLTQLALPANGLDARYTFTAPGVVTLSDERHPEADPAYIVVVENRYFDISDGQGRFTIAGVPAGTYTLQAWHKDRGSRTFIVTFAEANERKVEFILEEPKLAELSPTHLPVSTSAEGE